MIIIFKTNVGTAAYDSDTILNLEYTTELGLYITFTATNKLNSVVKTKHHYLKNDAEFDKILEQWQKSKEKKFETNVENTTSLTLEQAKAIVSASRGAGTTVSPETLNQACVLLKNSEMFPDDAYKPFSKHLV